MAIGVSYFGNRILRHAAADMADLAARGFTGVLHTFSENDLFYYREQVGELVRLSHEAGLAVQVGPWGLGHAFGGEAESLFTAQHPEVGQVLSDGRRVGAGCLSNPAFGEFVRRWASAAVETGADTVFWDEPHWAHPERFEAPAGVWGCRCEHCRAGFRARYGQDMPATLTPEVAAFRDDVLVAFLGEAVARVAAAGARSTVCLLPLTEGPLGLRDWEPVAALPGLTTLATDPYWRAFDRPVEPFVSAMSDRVRRLADRYGIGAQIWVQGFGLGPQDAEDIRTAVAAARDAGVEDLWTWGYEACGHMPALGTREPARVWQVLCEALTGGAAPVGGGQAGGAPGDRRGQAGDHRGQAGDHRIGTPPAGQGGAPPAGAGEDLSRLGTEQVRSELADLDLRPTSELVRLLAAEHVEASRAVVAVADALAVAVDAVAARFGRGGRLVYAGAGTAGRLGLLDAVEARPTFGTQPGRVVALLAGGSDRAGGEVAEGAEDDRQAGEDDIAACGLGPDDTLVGVSASGRTPYVLGAAAAARAAGALTVGVAGNRGSALAAAVDHVIEVDAGPEPLAGSTRLKAGTAQKAVLNTLSTAVMVRVGKTYGNLMVDVQASNDKLRDRARRIVAEVAGVELARADAALAEAGGEAKTAIAALVRGVGVDEARRLLAEAGGRLRTVLGR